MHYYIAGSGPPLLLIHGTPKTNYYWQKLVPLLTPYFTVVAPDVRGFGYTDRPPAAMRYNNTAQAADMAGLMSLLGFERFTVHGEDRGAEYAYAVAAIYRDRVMKLSFCEMLLSGVSLDTWSYFTPENVNAQYELRGVWQWHIPFLWIANVPEMLITGKEAEFWTYFMEAECYNPISISREAITEWIDSIKAPGGLRGVLETYRADLVNRQINNELRQNPLTLPVMTIGAPEFFGVNVREEMLQVGNNVQQSYIFEECGHSLALEAEVRLAGALVGFFLGNGSDNSSTATSTIASSTATQ
ncbi:putative hydrolase or acyltransferase of alpha/beta superfamily [Paraphaeosphaeria sporulosa]|uniref:Putative hydrolase or acyltransferase of alpha/beta superfamily n=1 Tax=Paraphaeosphaeria sporulosa TaxID=1460663 RepID=A0A177CGK5_9PLEO|nr:putative hydrolase or acyltransferase of alpha/beta superfamily [Paraphaeosphaeria sporulosa]OAG05890.1 putative hydrolase or acyltransferase of alpha/beta superfamily [Paraphaeosphaeria sporulosa]